MTRPAVPRGDVARGMTGRCVLATNVYPSRQRPVERRIPSNADTNEALRVLRERYRATIANTVAALRQIAVQLTAAPNAPEIVDALRRELHRIHGTAGSYGFADASRLAADLEQAAVRWAIDPAMDLDRRASMTAEFADALELCVEGVASAHPPPRPQASPPATDGGRQPELIIVEDDPSLVEMLAYAFTTAGLSFRHFDSGPEALEGLLALEVGSRRPVILLDVDLPGLDGFSLHERLRVERPGVFTTVFLTARAGEAEQLRAYRAGAIDYVPKPVNLRILMAKLPSWLDLPRRSA
jgi:CheY-like chemotaxis protein/HPt (histidine-containing phosphotransfer) domain-containing protein